MRKIGVLGSCLAGMTSVMLINDYRWIRLNNAAIDRSDVFAKYFVRQEPMPSREVVETALAVKPEDAVGAKEVIDRMFRDGVGLSDMPPATRPLADNLRNEQFDLFLLDNQCDTYFLKTRYLSLSGKLDFEFAFPLQWSDRYQKSPDSFQIIPCQEPADSARNWAEIVRHLQSVQPAARIVFLCATSSTVERDDERRARADRFEAALRSALGATDIDIVPPLRVPRELTKLPDDQDHFDMAVYRALAGRVFTSFHMARHARDAAVPGVADAA